MTQGTFSELSSIQLSLIGISFSIFTILYSIVLGKLEVLRNIASQIKQGNKSPELKQAEHLCIKYIRKLKRMNVWAILICSVSILLFGLMSIIKNSGLSNWLYYSVYALNIIDFTGVLSVIITVFISYFKDTKFD